MENIIFGIVTGCILLLGAVGFSMIQKAENFIHVAHGQFLMLGAFLTYFFNVTLGWPFMLAAASGVVCTAALGYLCSRFLIAPVRKEGGLVLLFTSIGLAQVLYGVIAAVFGTRIRAFQIPPTTAMEIGGRPLATQHEILAVLIALGSGIGLHLFLTRTRLGKMIRAMASNYQLARVRGIDTDQLSTFIWLLATGMAALAGILLGVIGSVNIHMGWSQILMILAATVLGGMGSIYGVMAASLLLGLGMDLSVLVLPSHYRTSVAFVIIILVLYFWPEGVQGVPNLFSRLRRLRPMRR